MSKRHFRAGRACDGRGPAGPARVETLEGRRLMSVAAGWFAAAVPPAAAAAVGVEAVSWGGRTVQAGRGDWLVQLTAASRGRAATPAAAQRLFDGTGARVIRGLGGVGQLLVRLPATAPAAAQAKLKALASRGVIAGDFSPNLRVAAAGLPNDPGLPETWGLHNVGQAGGKADADVDAPEAWGVSAGSRDVVVGVIDTGIDYAHPDLAANLWRNPGEVPGNGLDDDGNGFRDDVYGYDFANDDPDPRDDHYHGTHVAGTIGAVGNNNAGVSGVAQRVSLMALKFLRADGRGSLDAAVRAVNYATLMRSRGVNVVATNNSWAGGPYVQALRDAIADAGRQGVLFVAAAGNEANDNDAAPTYPASYRLDNVIAVAASTRQDQPAGFSNVGRTTVHLAAPGQDVYSTLPGGRYGTLSGTSMAAPHVTGAIALGKAVAPLAGAAALRNAVLASVDKVAAFATKVATGGRLNAYGLLRALGGAPAKPAAPTGLRATATAARTVGLAWVDTSSNETGFEVGVSRDGATFAPAGTAGANQTTAQASGLQPGTRYWFAVRAVNGAGASGYSDAVEVTTPAEPAPVPAAPGNLRVVAADRTSVDLAWEDRSGNETAFRVAVSRDDGATWDKAGEAGADATSFRVGGLAPGARYLFRVRAANPAGYSGYSNVAAAATRPGGLAAPANLRAAGVEAAAVSLAWDDLSDNETAFRVAVSRDGANWDNVGEVGANVTGFRAAGLAPGTRYFFRVRAANGGGYSDYTNVVDVTTATPPPTTAPAAPGNLRADDVWARTVDLAWDDRSDNETAFRVAVSRDGVSWDNVGEVGPNVTRFRVKDLSPSTRYFLRVRAAGVGGYSEYTPAVEVRTRSA